MDKRTYIIEIATKLFQKKGYMSVGLNEILQTCNISKGALYHYFPEGKEQLLITCLETLSQMISEDMEQIFHSSTSTRNALQSLLHKLIRSYDNEGTIAGYTFTSIVSEMGAVSENIRLACVRLYENIEHIIASKLEQEGLSSEAAANEASLIVSTIEGGIMLSLTKRSSRPLRIIAQQLDQKLKTE